jgi:hemoglobin
MTIRRFVVPLAAAILALAGGGVRAAEEPVKPYVQSDANAGAAPFTGDAMLRAFHGRDGVNRVVDGLVDRAVVDPRIADIFKGQDIERLRRTLKEQFCYLLNGGCAYTGRDMRASHRDLGLQQTDFNALVEDLQIAMDRERVPFRAQNRLLAKLAPMERAVVVR